MPQVDYDALALSPRLDEKAQRDAIESVRRFATSMAAISISLAGFGIAVSEVLKISNQHKPILFVGVFFLTLVSAVLVDWFMDSLSEPEWEVLQSRATDFPLKKYLTKSAGFFGRLVVFYGAYAIISLIYASMAALAIRYISVAAFPTWPVVFRDAIPAGSAAAIIFGKMMTERFNWFPYALIGFSIYIAIMAFMVLFR